MKPLPLLLVATGGAAGALARYAVGVWAGTAAPVTMTINLVGCFAMGVLVGALTGTGRRHEVLRPLIGTGFLGGFTTFSAASLDVVRLAERAPGAAGAVLLGTLAGCVVAVAAGEWVGTHVTPTTRATT